MPRAAWAASAAIPFPVPLDMTRAHKPDVPLENAAGIVHYPEVLDRIGAFY
jgi:hypothetical protein